MLILSIFIPVFATLVLGLVFLFLGAASPGFKLAGMLIQIALAHGLAIWRKADIGST